MSDHSSTALAEPSPAPRADATPDNGLNYLLAGLMAGSAAIHFAMVPAHAGGESMLDPLAFAVMGWFQLTIAGLLVAKRANAAVYTATVLGNLAIIGLWVWSRNWGLPIGSHAGEIEEAGSIDQLATALEVGAVVVAGLLLAAPSKIKLPAAGAAIAGVAVLGLATSVIVSPDAANVHSHDGADDHHAAAAVEMELVDETRCDRAFNPQAYWEETAFLGIDTYTGGAMTSDHHDASSTSLFATINAADPTEGRGSATLDDLVSSTEAAGAGEAAAAGLIVGLSEASDEEYDAWLNWLKVTGQVGGSHAHEGGGDDAGGHGGHVGPQPWVAMVDQEQCDTLAAELELARETAMKYPTAADATAAGWRMVTPYVPGIAAHYMKFSVVDDTFEITEPEMILYDGNSPDSAIVGLSYYILHDGTLEPTSGFTGPNDHYHRHVGLCTVNGLVVGDSTTTKEECEARGGRKNDGSKGWMSHAWVVPGCESPWGVFSAASPLLDGTLVDNSTTDGGGCAGSGVRDRYDLSPGVAAVPESDDGATESADGN